MSRARSACTTKTVSLPALLLALCALAAPARADVGATIIERCTNGKSLSGFSQQAYSKALQEMPAEVSEYSECANLIRKAQLAAAGGGTGGGSGSSGPSALTASVSPPTPAERQALAHAAAPAGSAPVHIAGGDVHPGVVHANIASAVSTLPTPLLALLALLLACALTIVGSSARDRARARRRR